MWGHEKSLLLMDVFDEVCSPRLVTRQEIDADLLESAGSSTGELQTSRRC